MKEPVTPLVSKLALGISAKLSGLVFFGTIAGLLAAPFAGAIGGAMIASGMLGEAALVAKIGAMAGGVCLGFFAGLTPLFALSAIQKSRNSSTELLEVLTIPAAFVDKVIHRALVPLDRLAVKFQKSAQVKKAVEPVEDLEIAPRAGKDEAPSRSISHK